MITWTIPIENAEQLKDLNSVRITVEQPEENGTILFNCEFLDKEAKLIRNDRLVHIQKTKDLEGQTQSLTS
jgi:hypothetical protein